MKKQDIDNLSLEKTHIRFDWAVKRLLRNKANFVVLEGFLTELIGEDIKISSVLESEANQQTYDDKFNRVDILVENSKKELILIEIQNDSEYDYFHKMIYGTSKLITEYIKLGDNYENVKKVYSINIVYFELGQGKDYVYKGTTIFHGIHRPKDKLILSEKQKDIYKKELPSDIYPTYYVIKVNSFNDIAKDTLDEWIYFLKNNIIKKTFKAKGLKEADEILRIDRLTPNERLVYKKYLESLRYESSRAFTMKVEAEDIARKDERNKRNLEIAKIMKQKGYPIKEISELTGISKEEIEKL